VYVALAHGLPLRFRRHARGRYRVPVALTNGSGPSETRGRAQREVAENDMPPALARHLERLKALPGNGGESLEGPSSAAEASFLQRAFPDADIPLARIAAARRAFKGYKGKGCPKGKGRPGVWVTIGPSFPDRRGGTPCRTR
jgi:hypothetical protein